MLADIDNALIKKTLKLNPQERFLLMEILAESLDKPDSVLDETWLKEAETRLKFHREGKTKGVPVEPPVFFLIAFHFRLFWN